MSDDIAALKAQLAAAEARAKQAEAEAARAQAEALRLAVAAQMAGTEAGAEVPTAEVSTGEDPGPKADDTEAADTEPSDTGVDDTEDYDPGHRGDQGPVEVPPWAEEAIAAYDMAVPYVTLGTGLDGGDRIPSLKAKVPLSMFNRHMLVAGATGTGKTRTLQLLSEALSDAGTAVLLCDVKGDLTGLGEPGQASAGLQERTELNGQPWRPQAFPVELFTLPEKGRERGAKVRVPVSDFGPLLLARALELNTTQEQALQLVFSWADDNNLELVDLSDLRAVIGFLTSPDGKAELDQIGGLSKATAGVILRNLTAFSSEGADEFFGEPGFDTLDLIRQSQGRGVISLLEVGDIFTKPTLVSAVIMWMLADLFARLPEVGDAQQPKLVFFFDEAHLLFSGATKEFLRQVVQTVRLIRSKGVGVVFVTQTPKDIPADVLAQLSSKVQHALRASTPNDYQRLKQTIATFPRTELNLEEILPSLGTGEAIVTVLDPKGRPTPVVPVSIWAPASVMGPASPTVIDSLTRSSALAHKYGDRVNPHSAEEKLTEAAQLREQQRAAEKEALEAQKEADRAAVAAKKEQDRRIKELEAQAQKAQKEADRAAQKQAEQRNRLVNNMLNSAARSASSSLGASVGRAIFGTRRR